MPHPTPCARAALWLCALTLAWPGNASAQQAAESGAPAPDDPAQVPSEQAPTPDEDEGFFGRFFDDEDGKLDFSQVLARGGFIPIPIIISEPAVDGGFGLAAAFISANPDDPRNVTRRRPHSRPATARMASAFSSRARRSTSA